FLNDKVKGPEEWGFAPSMSACPVCYRDIEPVAGRCPSCGALRGEARAGRELGAGGRSGATAPSKVQPILSAASSFGADEKTPPRKVPQPAATVAAVAPRMILKGPVGDVTEFPLGDNNVLGRSTTATVRLADRAVSRKHSQVDKEAEDYVLRDLGSSNGTFLNGKRIFGPTKLKDGDEVV